MASISSDFAALENVMARESFMGDMSEFSEAIVTENNKTVSVPIKIDTKVYQQSFEYGYKGRTNGVPFDTYQSSEWKRGWLTKADEMLSEWENEREQERIALEARIAHNNAIYAARVNSCTNQPVQNTNKENDAYIAKAQAMKIAEAQRKNANKAARAEECRRIKNIRSGPSKGKK